LAGCSAIFFFNLISSDSAVCFFAMRGSLLVVVLKPAIDLDAAKTNQSSGALRALSTRRIKEK
jgi:hypothetical protein